MRYSKNFNLKLPEVTDPVKVSDLSENFEALDVGLINAFPEEVSGALSMPTLTNIQSATAKLSLGKPIKRIIFYLHVTVTRTNTTATGAGDGTLMLATRGFGGKSAVDGSFSLTGTGDDGTTSTSTYEFAASASIPQLDGTSSVDVTFSSKKTGTYNGRLYYCALLGE